MYNPTFYPWETLGVNDPILLRTKNLGTFTEHTYQGKTPLTLVDIVKQNRE